MPIEELQSTAHTPLLCPTLYNVLDSSPCPRKASKFAFQLCSLESRIFIHFLCQGRRPLPKQIRLMIIITSLLPQPPACMGAL